MLKKALCLLALLPAVAWAGEEKKEITVKHEVGLTEEQMAYEDRLRWEAHAESLRYKPDPDAQFHFGADGSWRAPVDLEKRGPPAAPRVLTEEMQALLWGHRGKVAGICRDALAQVEVPVAEPVTFQKTPAGAPAPIFKMEVGYIGCSVDDEGAPDAKFSIGGSGFVLFMVGQVEPEW